MWAAVSGWLPGLTRAMDRAQLGIVPTPADMQAESDTSHEPAPARTRGSAHYDPDDPGEHATPCDKPGCALCGPTEPPPKDPTATPPQPSAVATGQHTPRSAPAPAPVPDPVPDAAPRRRAPTLEQSLQAANIRLRRERDSARADAARYARQLAAARQLLTDLEYAGICVSTFVDVAGTRVLRLQIPGRTGPRDLLFELPPVRTNPLYDLDGSTTSGGVGGPSGSAAAGAVDGSTGPVRLGEADRTGGAARDH